MTPTEQDWKRLQGIFFPARAQRETVVISSGGRFAYYTSAHVASQILSSEEIWMRNTAIMNDYMEGVHGLACLRASFQTESLKGSFVSALEKVAPGLAEEVVALFNQWIPILQEETYITCVSEHAPSGFSHEDRHGRLSMWRAYGGEVGVALILRCAPMFRETDALGAYASPVSYVDAAEFSREFEKLSCRIIANHEFLGGLDRQVLKNATFNFLRLAMLCTKHPGFHEEREWRVISTPRMHPSKNLKRSVEVVRGLPQLVHKIPLRDIPGEGLFGITIPDLIERVIVGPCSHPKVTRDAFISLLESAGAKNASERVVVSGIPIRTKGA